MSKPPKRKKTGNPTPREVWNERIKGGRKQAELVAAYELAFAEFSLEHSYRSQHLQDHLQNVVLRILVAAQDNDGARNDIRDPASYLFSVARREHSRAEATARQKSFLNSVRDRPRCSTADAGSAVGQDPQCVAIQRELTLLAGRLLWQLPDDTASVVYLRWQGFSSIEIARQLGISRDLERQRFHVGSVAICKSLARMTR